MSDADFIVIGSGPAGVCAALALTGAGRSVLMLDGAQDDGPSTPDNAARVLGNTLEGLTVEDDLSPKLRTPEARRALAQFAQSNNIHGENFLPAGALSRGGLSRVWGAFTAEFDDSDLADWPIDHAALAPSYARITARIGISGKETDTMSALLGRSGQLQQPPPLGAASARLLSRYDQQKPKNFKLGHARNALLSQPLAGRGGCDLRGACLWGCPIGAIYDARQDLALLRQRTGFQLANGACVATLTRETGCWRVDTRDGRVFRAPRLLIAAGTLGSSRLVAPLFPALDNWRLLSNPTVATPLLVLGALAASTVATHTLAQLAYSIETEDNGRLIGAVYETNLLPASGFAGRLPFGRRAGEPLVRWISPALLIAVTSFPGNFSRNWLRFNRASGILSVQGGFEPTLDVAETTASKVLKGAWRRLGAWVLPGARRATAGTDAHFVGTLPMGGKEANATSPLGELAGWKDLHIVDGSVLPSLPAKHVTLTIMANADRIATELARE